MLGQDSQEKSLADKKRAILIKNAYLGLEKVENCHKVKSQKMQDQVMLRILMRQYERDKYITSLTTYRSQQVLKARLGEMVARSDVQLARVSGDREKMKKLLTEMNEKQASNLAGPTAVEEVLFQQVLESRRENLIDMRKPENYSKKGNIKGFWEEDEEFYKTFEGAIRNPFQMIDGMMEKYGNGGEDCEEKKPFARRTKSLSAVEKMSFTKQRDVGLSSSQRKSALPKLTNPLREITQIHEKTTQDLTKDLEARQKTLYENIQPLVVEQDRNHTDVLRMLDRFDHSKKVFPSNSRLPDISLDSPAASSIRSRDEWKKLFATSQTSNLTWKTTTRVK